MLKAIVLAIAFVPMAAAAITAVDFKGIKIGGYATPESVQQAVGVTCGAAGSDGGQECKGYVTIAKEEAYCSLTIDEKGVVQQISLLLAPDVFDSVAPEMIRKYGKPTKTNRGSVQNRMGAKYEQVKHIWQATDGSQIWYSKYVNTLDDSLITFSTKAVQDKNSDATANRAGDL